MVQPRAIELGGKPLGGGRVPAICAPLVGRTREQLLAEVASVAGKKPALLEWRVDFYEGIADTAEVVRLAGRINAVAGGIPLLFTRRSSREGGEPIPLLEPQVIALYGAVCGSGHVDLVDYEMSNTPDEVCEMRERSRTAGVQLVLSFHDFNATPPLAELQQKFALAEQLGGDIAKVAVMPRDMEDVLTLLSATLLASRTLSIPVISMSMGGAGAITRLAGGLFGSALSFAVGQQSSAPGQWPIEELGTALALLRKASGA